MKDRMSSIGESHQESSSKYRNTMFGFGMETNELFKNKNKNGQVVLYDAFDTYTKWVNKKLSLTQTNSPANFTFES